MKRFLKLNSKLHWEQILPRIGRKISCLLMRDNDNFIVGWDIEQEIIFNNQFDFGSFQNFREANKNTYTFGYLSYDVKNVIETKLSSKNPDTEKFPEAYFFVPRHVIVVSNGQATYFGQSERKDVLTWLNEKTESLTHPVKIDSLLAKTSESDYIKSLEGIKRHIQQGDIYEMNYCIQFAKEAASFDSTHVFKNLRQNTQAPFTALFNFDFGTILSASPERFFKHQGNKLTSQPIKGTAARNLDEKIDLQLLHDLEKNEKETAENVMIVDLVRNDLSKIAEKNSVTVEELCKGYTFKTVHQLISTISCQLKANVSDSEIIKSLFPMGSMTGAPKIRAMELAEEYESFKRGIYSGTIGCFHPNGNSDFNVVIRSIIYSKVNGTVSASVGGAITIGSDPQKEYQECLTKLKALQDALC